jgi:hypothetical protein
MKLFFKNILIFILTTLSLWIVYVIFLVVNILLIPKNYKLYHNHLEIEKGKIFIMGNSHPECAINDSLMGETYSNISLSAEPLFYTAIKAQNIINQNKPDTLIIEFENTALHTIHWVLADDRLVENYKFYFSLMTFNDHKFLFENNFRKALKTFIFLTLNDINNYKNINGGYLYLIRDNIISPSKKIRDQYAGRSDKFEYPADIQNRNIESLFNLIDRNKSTFFIITRMPIYKTQKWDNEDTYLKYVDRLKQIKNCAYYDFSNKFSLADSCFGDETHLNYKGAKIFTPFFKATIMREREK